MNYNEIVEQINLKQAIEDYGFSISKGGYISCPFHNDKTPSMKIYDDHYYCFSCGEHGNVINFVAGLLNISIFSAAQELADRYNIVTASESSGTGSGYKPTINSRLERARQETAVNYFTRVITKFCKVAEQKIEVGTMPVVDMINLRTDIERADGILEMLMHTENNKRYEFINGFKESLSYYENKIKEFGNISCSQER